MSQGHDEQQSGQGEQREDLDDQQREMAEIDEQLDAEADGEGLAAEAGRIEENGISQG
ncbi:hypothetical protein [Nocardioides flavescens]|uniref:Uncharacterized protein n=1 Tax=Nocardioides flavescens TaxID=2691959 RepID=A0A6L7EY84_9ACTN|nr:hypothetical protein [Nocardioides flavescens]MXG90558.1 hypothetical protein [Nocardioides flavescens]